MRRTVTACAALLLAACGESEGPDAATGTTGFASVRGTYVLARVDGVPLPLLLSSVNGVQRYLTADTLRLGLSYDVSQRFVQRTVAGGVSSDLPGLVAYGYAVPAQNTIVVTQGGVPLTGTGHVTSGRLHFSSTSAAQYGQHAWDYRCVPAGPCP